MRTAARPSSFTRLADGLLAPARWLEKARGRRRQALALLYVAVVAVSAFLCWWASSLNGLPNVGDPFDVSEFDRVSVPDEDNAFVLYRQARDRFEPLDQELSKLRKGGQSWSQVAPEIRAWVESNREAIHLWQQGAERSRALVMPPRELDFDTNLGVLQSLRDIVRVADLDAGRLEESGDPIGAWGRYRAILRCSRHVGISGCVIARLVGGGMLQVSAPRIIARAANPQVNADMLREALHEVNACEAMTPPVSEAIKIEYLSLMKELGAPQRWVNHSLKEDKTRYHHLRGSATVRMFVCREPERIQRIARLIFANWLAFCDRPPNQRPKLATALDLYEPEANAPKGATALPPQTLERWEKSAFMLGEYLPNVGVLLKRGFDRERGTFGALKVHLAEQLYLREHGVPPKTLGALVGPYLVSLPDGFEPDEPPESDPPDSAAKHVSKP
jgi:hypothetical protein